MSGNANKNPRANQSVEKKTSSVTPETSIVKPTKENYYEVNTRNEQIIRDKYVELEKTYTEVQSEIQTFNKNYKRMKSRASLIRCYQCFLCTHTQNPCFPASCKIRCRKTQNLHQVFFPFLPAKQRNSLTLSHHHS